MSQLFTFAGQILQDKDGSVFLALHDRDIANFSITPETFNAVNMVTTNRLTLLLADHPCSPRILSVA